MRSNVTLKFLFLSKLDQRAEAEHVAKYQSTVDDEPNDTSQQHKGSPGTVSTVSARSLVYTVQRI